MSKKRKIQSKKEYLKDLEVSWNELKNQSIYYNNALRDLEKIIALSLDPQEKVFFIQRNLKLIHVEICKYHLV